MTHKTPPKDCDTCGEDDGSTKRVVLRVGGKVKFHRSLCRSCQWSAIVAVAAPLRRGDIPR